MYVSPESERVFIRVVNELRELLGVPGLVYVPDKVKELLDENKRLREKLKGKGNG